MSKAHARPTRSSWVVTSTVNRSTAGRTTARLRVHPLSDEYRQAPGRAAAATKQALPWPMAYGAP
eukprot:6618118-Prymnesium_polylepis.1